MALVPLCFSKAWSPEQFAAYPDEVRHRELRIGVAEALVGIGRITTHTEDAPLHRFDMGTHARKRIVETLEVWVDPLVAHTKAAAKSEKVAFLSSDGFERRMIADREKEIADREEKLVADLAELEAMRRELRDDRARVIQDFHGYSECMGRR